MRNLYFDIYGVQEMCELEMRVTESGFVESGDGSNSFGEFFLWIENGIT